MASMFRNLFRPKASAPVPPAAAASPEVEGLYAEATKAYQARDLSRAIALYERVIALQPNHAEAYYKRGNALKDLGQLAPALTSYDAALEHKPDFAYAWCNRGVVQQNLNLHDAALASFDQAIKLDPTDAFAHSNRGSLLQEMSRWEEAVASYDRALELNPQMPQVWFHRGNLLRELRRMDAALMSYQEALRLEPNYAEAHYNCAVLQEKLQRPDAALASYDRALELVPEFHQAHYNRAGVLKALKQPQAALAAYDRAIAAKADYAVAHANRGTTLQELGRLEEALASYNQAIALRPDSAESHFNRGTLFAAQARHEEALADYARALALRPDYAEAYCEQANALLEIGRLEAALASYNRAVTIQPDFAEAQYNRALALLLSGDFTNGWLSHEWRWRSAARLSLDARHELSQPLWLGKESLAGKRLLIYSEQGLGDALQFSRFAKPLADRGATVIFEVQPQLAGLLETVDGISRVVVDGGPLPEFDYRCPVMSLPLALNTTLNTIPAARGYLRSDTARVKEWQARLGNPTRPRIGLTWSGNPKHGNDRNRSFRLADWIEHLPREFQYVCLQKDIRAADEATLNANPWISRFDSELRDLRDTAALCECLDLVISVDTSVLHLSAALGRPTWVLLPFNPDWRWLLGRDDSPWYHAAQLYRQRSIGDWTGVFTRVAADLRVRFAQ